MGRRGVKVGPLRRFGESALVVIKQFGWVIGGREGDIPMANPDRVYPRILDRGHNQRLG